MSAAAALELLERALAAGAEQAEVCATHGDSIAVEFEKNDLKITHVDEHASLGLRAAAGRKLGFASTNQTNSAALAETARAAFELARLSVADEHNVLPAPREIAAPLPLTNARVAALRVEDAVERGRDFLARLLAVDRRVTVDKADLSVARGVRVVRTSTGIAAEEHTTTLGVGVFGMARDGEDVGGFDYWGDTVHDLDDLDAAVRETVERFTSTVLGNLNAQPAESYRGAVLFAPQAFEEVFIAPILSGASALAVQRGRSALAGKLGEQIASPTLNITDDPADTTLAHATRFDREGQPATRRDIVAGGVLRSYLYNAYAAHAEGRTSTGHAIGGPRSVPGLGPNAISVAPGAGGDLAALFRALGRGLYVQRFSGTVDPTSGDFSGVAKSARWIENGAPVRSLRETLISGNAFELLKDAITLGSVSERIMGMTRVPPAIVDRVSVPAG
jgi:PmbA protein